MIFFRHGDFLFLLVNMFQTKTTIYIFIILSLKIIALHRIFVPLGQS